MLANTLYESTQLMDTVTQLNEEKKRLTNQFNMVNKYSQVVDDLYNYTECLHYANENFHFSLDQQMIDRLMKLHEELLSTSVTGYVHEDSVSNCKKETSKLKQETASKWNLFYKDYVNNVKSLLMVIRGLVGSDYDIIQSYLDTAKTWNNVMSDLERLKEGIDRSHAMIEKLNLDDDVINFLQKVNQGRATFNDITEDVENWIRKESMGGRIKLSFNSRW